MSELTKHSQAFINEKLALLYTNILVRNTECKSDSIGQGISSIPDEMSTRSPPDYG